MDVNVESMNWLVTYCAISCCSNMRRVSVLLYSVSLNNNMKQRAFTLLDLVLWRRYSPVKLTHRPGKLHIHIYYYIRNIIASYSILSFYLSWVDLCTASLNHSCREAVRKVRSPFRSRCDPQLKGVKTGTFLHRIQHVPN